MWGMDSENSDDYGPDVILIEDDEQEIGCLINSDGEEVDYPAHSKQINSNSKVWCESLEE